jgi:4-amino-4-deoxy-L-arabinose transferase-like glycosyltransferase
MKMKESVEKILDKRCLTVGFLILLAFSVRVAKPFLVDRISKDGVLYVYMADDIARGDLNEAFKRNNRIPPLYLFLMAGLGRVGLESETAGVLISVVAGVLLIIPVFLMAEMIFGPRVATVSGFLAAVNPNLVNASSQVMRDSLFLFFLFCSLYLLFKALDGKKWNLIFWSGAGFCSLLAAATRTEGFEMIGVALLAATVEAIVLLKHANPLSDLIRKRVAGLLCMCLVYYAASLPFSMALEHTPSTWSCVDNRIPGFLRGLLHITTEDALKSEDTL